MVVVAVSVEVAVLADAFPLLAVPDPDRGLGLAIVADQLLVTGGHHEIGRLLEADPRLRKDPLPARGPPIGETPDLVREVVEMDLAKHISLKQTAYM